VKQAAVALVLALAACHRATEEERVRAMLDDGSRQVEHGKVAAAVDHLTDDFKDGNGADKQTVKMIVLREVLQGGGEARIYRRNEAITVESGAGQASFDALLMRGNDKSRLGTWHFVLTLRKDGGEWKISAAQWRPIPATDFVTP